MEGIKEITNTVPNMKMVFVPDGFKEVTKWITSDGQEFSNESSAMAHQEIIHQEEEKKRKIVADREMNVRAAKRIKELGAQWIPIECGSHDERLAVLMRDIFNHIDYLYCHSYVEDSWDALYLSKKMSHHNGTFSEYYEHSLGYSWGNGVYYNGQQMRDYEELLSKITLGEFHFFIKQEQITHERHYGEDEYENKESLHIYSANYLANCMIQGIEYFKNLTAQKY